MEKFGQSLFLNKQKIKEIQVPNEDPGVRQTSQLEESKQSAWNRLAGARISGD